MSDSNRNYEVGYGRPPKHSRFQPGKSGNPKGRSKGTLNLKTDLTEELGERIRVREGDRERTITKQRAMIKALLAKSLKGDSRATSLLLALIGRLIEPDIASTSEPVLSANDQAIFDELMARLTNANRTDTSKEG